MAFQKFTPAGAPVWTVPRRIVDAAANIEGSSRLQQLFRERASERRQVVEDLRAEVRRLGGNPEDDGSFLGKTHQRFLDLKAAVTGRDDKAIINEVERGEDYLKEKFETALNSEELTGESRAAVDAERTCMRSCRTEKSGSPPAFSPMTSPSTSRSRSPCPA